MCYSIIDITFKNTLYFQEIPVLQQPEENIMIIKLFHNKGSFTIANLFLFSRINSNQVMTLFWVLQES